MKILSYTPKLIAEPGALDDSRLGFWVEQKNLEDLDDLPHGIAIFGFADDTGVKNVGGRIGAAKGPEEIRKRLYKFTTGKTNSPVYDLGDLQSLSTIEETLAAATEFVRKVHAAGHIAIPLGGGHDFGFPQALGLLAATQKSCSIINLDAHLDLRPTNPKITSGSPWFLLAEHALYAKTKSKLVEFGIQRHCNAETLVSYAKHKKIEIHWLDEIRKKKKSLHDQFQTLLLREVKKKSVIVSLDIDGVAWQFAPGCSAPQVEGFDASEVMKMSYTSGKNKSVKSFGIFETSPPLDLEGKTSTLAAHCIKEFLRGKGCLD